MKTKFPNKRVYQGWINPQKVQDLPLVSEHKKNVQTEIHFGPKRWDETEVRCEVTVRWKNKRKTI
jgi:hypothetical protein